MSACYSKYETIADGEETKSYFSFTLSEDSWVLFKGNFSLFNHDGMQTHVSIYSDSAFSNLRMEYGWGYWEWENECTVFLKKGTYYGMMFNKHANFKDFEGNVNIIAGAVPVSKVFGTEQKISAKKTSVTVVLSNVLGKYCKRVVYCPGSISADKVSDNTYWDTNNSENGVIQLQADGNNNYTFTSKQNTSYTIMIEDIYENRYSQVINVSGIDKTKPKVTGVKNKKTYHKAVKIKFSDKESGIKSATLNGKKIKSGKKVSKNGSYTLVVKDKAGNTTKIKFKIKR